MLPAIEGTGETEADALGSGGTRGSVIHRYTHPLAKPVPMRITAATMSFNLTDQAAPVSNEPSPGVRLLMTENGGDFVRDLQRRKFI